MKEKVVPGVQQPSPALRGALTPPPAAQNLSDAEVQFLIAEFETAWSQIAGIETRRSSFLEWGSTIAVAAVGAAGFLVLGGQASTNDVTSSQRAVVAAVILIFASLALRVLQAVLLSERKGNVRYRKKVNLLRSLFLQTSAHPSIKWLLENREDANLVLAIDPQPSGKGSTLTDVVKILKIEFWGLLAAALGLLLNVLWPLLVKQLA